MERRTRREQNGSAARQYAEFIGTVKGFRVVPTAAVSRCSNTTVQKPDLLDHLIGARDERWR
jgi:hypothetical protein